MTKNEKARVRYANDSSHREKKKEYLKTWRAANREKIQAQKRAWYASNPDQREIDRQRARKNRELHLAQDPSFFSHRRRRYKYGLEEDRVTELFLGQLGCCAICVSTLTTEMVTVDHDHDTGRVRGVLCQSCNLGLGHFKDNVGRLEAAARYLRGFDEHAARVARSEQP